MLAVGLSGQPEELYYAAAHRARHAGGAVLRCLERLFSPFPRVGLAGKLSWRETYAGYFTIDVVAKRG